MAREKVDVFEVGPRDGLQNEPRTVSLEQKIWFVTSLVEAGIRNLEIGAFVRPDRVPQMADTDLIYTAFRTGKVKLKPAQSWCLVPNRRGLQRALRVGAKNIAVFTAATESFTQKNIGMSIQDSLDEFKLLIQEGRQALGSELHVRGYISTAFGCPFEGKVAPKKSLRVIERLLEIGANQISIGDTIGVATPADVDALIKPAFKLLGVKKTAVHFHDTRGTALANAYRALQLGVRVIDSSAGGLGGCPFAPGASGNLATEDLVYLLNGLGFNSGVNLDSLCKITLQLSKQIKRPLTSRYLQTFASQCDV